MFATLYCAIFRTSSLREFHRLFPTTVQAPAFYTLSAMFTGACDPPDKLSLALVPRSHVLRMLVALAHN